MESPQKTFETIQEIAESHSWKVFPNALGSITISKGSKEATLVGISSTNQITHINIFKCSIRFSRAGYTFTREGVEISAYDPLVTSSTDYESAVAEITALFNE
jgi:hypothetical protein